MTILVEAASAIEAVLTAADAAASDHFGYSVAVSADGTVMAVGARSWEGTLGTDAGGVYVFDRVSDAWVQRGDVLEEATTDGSDYFGTSVALSADGEVLVVGAEAAGSANAGAVFVYDRDGSGWTKRNSFAGSSSEMLGSAVALSADGEVLAIGARQYSGGGAYGGVYVYDRDGASWVQRGSILVPASPTSGMSYGAAVALSADGEVLVVGSPGLSSSRGGVFVYDRDGSGWTQRGSILVDVYEEAGNRYGSAVSLGSNGDRLMVGADYAYLSYDYSGAIFVYRRSGSAWTALVDGYAASDATSSARFGCGVALVEDSTRAVIGAYAWGPASPLQRGAVYTYQIGYGVDGVLAPAPSLLGTLSTPDDLFDSVGLDEALMSQSALSLGQADAAAIQAAATSLGSAIAATTSASISDQLVSTVFTVYLEAVGLSDSFTAGANTTASLTDNAAMHDVIRQAINQIVADIAAGADSLSLGAAMTLVDIADAVAIQTPSYNSVMLVAELIATLEAYNSAPSADIIESSDLSDGYVARVEALAAMLEAAQAVDTNTALVHVMQSATDIADGVTTITSAGSLLNALLNDGVIATIRLNIGGEMFTGWVLNADTLAPSEYQFADLQFNSACKHGDRYLLAADDGIYQFTEDAGVETVMTYIKTGKLDFDSDLKKRVVNSYIVYASSGDMVLKVTTSEFGGLVTRNYRVAARADDTTDVRRVDIGRGIKSRYWQFELVGDGVDCDIDEVGMLPVVLSRRI